MKDSLTPTPNPNHPAVGLLFAGGCNRTFHNPIGNVLSALNIQFLAGAGSTASVSIGDNVEKVGRTSEYQTSQVMEIDASPTITYDFGPASFQSQIATMWMSDPGDSGSIVCLGGKGSNTDNCACGTTTATSSILGVDVNRERMMAEEVRDKFLRHTKIGRYGLDLFFLNEERFLERFRGTKIKEEDRDLAQHLYKKYIEEVRAAFVESDRSERTLTEQHFGDARNALRHAHKYMAEDEVAASEELFKLAEERGKGKKPRRNSCDVERRQTAGADQGDWRAREERAHRRGRSLRTVTIRPGLPILCAEGRSWRCSNQRTLEQRHGIQEDAKVRASEHREPSRLSPPHEGDRDAVE